MSIGLVSRSRQAFQRHALGEVPAPSTSSITSACTSLDFLYAVDLRDVRSAFKARDALNASCFDQAQRIARKECRGWESNPHVPFRTQDFKSRQTRENPQRSDPTLSNSFRKLLKYVFARQRQSRRGVSETLASFPMIKTLTDRLVASPRLSGNVFDAHTRGLVLRVGARKRTWCFTYQERRSAAMAEARRVSGAEAR